MKIPDKYQEFCKAVCKLADENGLSRLNIKFSPGFDDWKVRLWDSEIQCSWASGRHGADAKRLIISSTILITTTIDTDNKETK